jgi:hypothetical protein
MASSGDDPAGGAATADRRRSNITHVVGARISRVPARAVAVT